LLPGGHFYSVVWDCGSVPCWSMGLRFFQIPPFPRAPIGVVGIIQRSCRTTFPPPPYLAQTFLLRCIDGECLCCRIFVFPYCWFFFFFFFCPRRYSFPFAGCPCRIGRLQDTALTAVAVNFPVVNSFGSSIFAAVKTPFFFYQVGFGACAKSGPAVSWSFILLGVHWCIKVRSTVPRFPRGFIYKKFVWGGGGGFV